MMEHFFEHIITHKGELISAFLWLVVGIWAIKRLKRAMHAALMHRDQDPTTLHFVIDMIGAFLLCVVLIIALSLVGVPTTSLLAILGASSLSIALALKDSLSHVASGILLIFEKPFRVGDSIEADGINGTVLQMSIFKIELKTPLNEHIYIPNARVLSSKIINRTRANSRRFDAYLYLDHQSDIAHVRTLIEQVLAKDTLHLEKPMPEVVLLKVTPQGLCIAIKVYFSQKHYDLRWQLLESIITHLQKHGVIFSKGDAP